MLLGFAVLSLITCIPLPAPSGSSLAGVVHDPENRPVVGAWLEARNVAHAALTAADFEGEPFRSMVTGKDGLWEFSDLTAGVWIITAVASTEPRTDAEFRELARPRTDGRAPAGVAITRLIRHIDGEGPGRWAFHGLGLAAASTATPTLHGRLTGAFDPDKYGYEVQVTLMRPGKAVSGMRVTSYSSDPSDPSKVQNIFSAVPDSEGRFDLGALEVTDQDFISVTRFPLDSYDANLEGTAFSGQFLQFKDRKEGFNLPLPGQHLVTLRAMAADGQTAADASAEVVTFNFWDEKGGEVNAEAWESSRRQQLPDGTYLANVTQGGQASPLIAFTLGGADGDAEFPLVLQPCPPFSVRLVDQQGTPLRDCFLTLGIEASAGFPNPCRVSLRCEGGSVQLENLLPGRYDVEILKGRKSSPAGRVDLRPGDAPVVVTVP